jgi:hypothetical protein
MEVVGSTVRWSGYANHSIINPEPALSQPSEIPSLRSVFVLFNARIAFNFSASYSPKYRKRRRCRTRDACTGKNHQIAARSSFSGKSSSDEHQTGLQLVRSAVELKDRLLGRGTSPETRRRYPLFSKNVRRERDMDRRIADFRLWIDCPASFSL